MNGVDADVILQRAVRNTRVIGCDFLDFSRQVVDVVPAVVAGGSAHKPAVTGVLGCDELAIRVRETGRLQSNLVVSASRKLALSVAVRDSFIVFQGIV